MIITNKLNLPTPFVSMLESNYEYKPKRYSVTAMLKPIQEIILERRHHHEIEKDVANTIWLQFGVAVHSILEKHQESADEIKELALEAPILDYTLSGRLDIYNDKTGTVTDYKTCSVYKILKKDFKDWERQCLIYCYLLKKTGFNNANNGEIVALMKDHSITKAKFEEGYPKFPVHVEKFDFTIDDFIEIEQFLKDKFIEIKRCEELPNHDLPPCTPEERWNDGDKYAVKRKNVKKALRVFNALEEANDLIEKNPECYVETRPGTNRKCEDYCNAAPFCYQYRQSLKEIKYE